MYEILVREVEDWRKPLPPQQRAKDPAGVALFELNVEYGRAKRELKEKYAAEAERLKGLIADKVPARKGPRPRPPYPDSLKAAAYRYYVGSGSKTAVRKVLGVADTQKLNTLLAEGKELVEATATEGDEGW